MPGYLVKHQSVAVSGVSDLNIRSLLDKQQYADPTGEAASLGISSAHWPLFGLLWPSGLHLASVMAQRPVVSGERILEIGCGLALASLVSHRRGAQVTASDCHPLAGAFLSENLRLNDLPPMAYRHGNWSADQRGSVEHPRACVEGKFELIIGSDVLYERDEAGMLPQFIERHATVVSEVLIIDPNRGNRSPFNRSMRGLGYALEETSFREPLGYGGLYRGRLLHYRRTGATLSVSGAVGAAC